MINDDENTTPKNEGSDSPIGSNLQSHHSVSNQKKKLKKNTYKEELCVGCWDQSLSFYDLQGNQTRKTIELEYDPCSISYYDNGKYILVGGSDNSVSLHGRDGKFLYKICEKSDWIWAISSMPNEQVLALGTNDGVVSTYQTEFSTVHGLYQDRYASRDGIVTDVVIQHLITEQRVRIKNDQYVKNT